MTRKFETKHVKPVFFPFTYIPTSIAERAFRLLGGVIVYQPDDGHIPASMRRLSKSGKIEIRVPVKEDADRLDQLRMALADWGIIHQGQGRVLKEKGDRGFYDSEFTAQIRSEILRDKQGSVLEKNDPLFSARLFLLLSQDYDIKQDEINQQLHASAIDHLNIFSGLKGEPATDRRRIDHIPGDDTGEYMTESRIHAWLRLMQADLEKSPILVTNSPFCFNYLFERVGRGDEAYLLETVSCSPGEGIQADMTASLTRLARTQWTGAGHGESDFNEAEGIDRAFLRLCILPGLSPDRLADRFIGGNGAWEGEDGGYPNTLLGLLKL